MASSSAVVFFDKALRPKPCRCSFTNVNIWSVTVASFGSSGDASLSSLQDNSTKKQIENRIKNEI